MLLLGVTHGTCLVALRGEAVTMRSFNGILQVALASRGFKKPSNRPHLVNSNSVLSPESCPEGEPRDLGGSMSPVSFILQRPRLKGGIRREEDVGVSFPGVRRGFQQWGLAKRIGKRGLKRTKWGKQTPLVKLSVCMYVSPPSLTEPLGQRSVRHVIC